MAVQNNQERRPNYSSLQCTQVHIFFTEITAPIFAINGFTLHTLAAVGLVIGVFAASVLWWETIVNDQDLQGVKNELIRFVDNNPRSYFIDRSYITLWYMAGVIPFCLLLFYTLSLLLSGSPRLPHPWLVIFLLIGLYIIAPIVPYLVIKFGRRWCSRWLERIRNAKDPNREIKNFLRFVGFVNLWAAGFLQLPATLF
jgi:hypothetical protein